MDTAALIAALRSARQSWVDLAGIPRMPSGAKVRILRPNESEFGRFIGGVTVDHVCEYVDGWQAFTEATIQGAAIGAEDAIDFSPALWREWVTDNVDCVEVIAKALSKSIGDHLKTRKAVSGN